MLGSLTMIFSILKYNNIEKYWIYRKQLKITKSYYSKWYLNRKIEKYNTIHNAYIPVSAGIQEFITPHGLNGILISSGAKLGIGCTIFQQVTIGSNTLQDSSKYGSPTIGNNVYIGAGAKIIGNVTIGDNVRVGANCVVTVDVPSNSTVVMNKPKIIYHAHNKDNTFLNWDNNEPK